MKTNKKKILLNLLWLFLGLILALVLAYLITTYARFKDAGVPLEEYIGNEYYSEQTTQYVVIKDDSTAIIAGNGAQTSYTYVYSDNIFTLTSSDGATVHFIATTDGALYGLDTYFYNTEIIE